MNEASTSIHSRYFHFLVKHRPSGAGVVSKRSIPVLLSNCFRVLFSMCTRENSCRMYSACAWQCFEPGKGTKETGRDRVTLSFSTESFGVAHAPTDF